MQIATSYMIVDAKIEDRPVKGYVYRLRKKPAKDAVVIKSACGLGYMMDISSRCAWVIP